ncbi:phosphotransferase family protein [Sphingomonas sp. 1P08PE]|uniref:phosphotransferase family protein n=1 Tax=Sphingomonas sp. 1P08PE TaxID=554122 RepID=UPI00399FBF04
MSAGAPTGGDTVPVADKDRLDLDALDGWMAAYVDDYAGPLSYVRFAGGQSNPTYRLDTPARSYVLRRKPFGPILPSAHAVEREYRVVAGLHPTGFPVPRPFGLCEDAGVIGAPFYVMEMVAGRTIWDGAMPGMTPAGRRAHYDAMIDTLAALHNTDHVAAGLEDYGRPGNYFERQVARWTKQYRASETERMEPVERLIDWLPRTLPLQTRTSIVHGDYRVDNLIYAPDAPRVAAVLDWELSTLGDPIADFSYLLMNWVTEPEGRSGVKGLAGPETGIPTIEEVVERYCAATGRDGVPQLDWYFAYNLFRLTGIVQGIKKRIIDGNAASAKAAETASRVGALADAAWHFAERAGA